MKIYIPLILVIYLSFVALGLPDTILGVSWPHMRTTFGLSLETAGILTIMVSVGTALSGYAGGFLIERFGTGKLVFISILMTGISLIGYSISPSFLWLLVFTLPLGIGAGAVDTGINHYVGIRYTHREMNWLHFFWGIGAFLGPNVINFSVLYFRGWRGGYALLGIVLLLISLAVFLMLPSWKKLKSEKDAVSHPDMKKGLRLLARKDVLLSVAIFPLYIAIEMGVGVWLASYLIEGRGFDKIYAGVIISLFFLSITIGRLLSGFLASKISNNRMIYGGLFVVFLSSILLNFPSDRPVIYAVVFLGLGCAPIYPGMLHNTPRFFGEENSHIITGYQIGSSYLSGVIIIPVIGVLARYVSIEVIPLSIVFFASIILFFMLILKNFKRSSASP